LHIKLKKDFSDKINRASKLFVNYEI